MKKYYQMMPDPIRLSFEERIWQASLSLRRKFLNAEVKEYRGSFCINYLEFGKKDGPVVVFFHGFGDEKHNFFITGKILSKEFRLIVPDIPGFGDSIRDYQASYNLEQYAKWFAEFFNHLGISKAHLMGNSLGGAIALRLAIDFPHLAQSLVLVNNAGVHPHEEGTHSLYDEFLKGENPFVHQGSEDFDHFLKRVFVKDPMIPLPIRQYWARHFRQSSDWYQKLINDLTFGQSELKLEGLEWAKRIELSLNPHLPQVLAPVLIIWGEEDSFFPVSIAHNMEEAFPLAKKIIYPGVGHSPQAEIPWQFAKDVRQFLRHPGKS